VRAAPPNQRLQRELAPADRGNIETVELTQEGGHRPGYVTLSFRGIMLAAAKVL
jgi:hypothetical protein